MRTNCPRGPSEARCRAGTGREAQGAREGLTCELLGGWRPVLGGAGATRFGGLVWLLWPGPGRPAAASAGLRRAGQRLGAAASILCSRCGVQRRGRFPGALSEFPGLLNPPVWLFGGCGGWARSILKVLPFSYPRLEDGFCHVVQFEKSMMVRASSPSLLFRMRSEKRVGLYSEIG